MVDMEVRRSTAAAADDTALPAHADDAPAEVDWSAKPLLTREHFHEDFDTNAYLKDFYAHIDDQAMQMVLTLLPGVAARLPRPRAVLDFGAGPTIHVAVAFRDYAEKIYLADYLPQNREELHRWRDARSSFDWSNTLRMIATNEGIGWDHLAQMEADARDKIAGIFHCDCLRDAPLDAPAELRFNVLVTILTLEYCCMCRDEYRAAIRRVVSLLQPGGYLVMGGIFEETWCSFGGRKFTCLFITRDFMLDCLSSAGLCVDFSHNSSSRMYEINGMFLLACRKE